MELRDYVGMRVRWSDMANYRTGVVYAARKPERATFVIGAKMDPVRVVFDVVWDDGHISRECALGRWEVLPGHADADEITQMLHNAEQTQARKEETAKAEAAENASIRASLPVLYPHLMTVESRKDWAPGRIAAENIRRELKRQFPGVKFSIRYRSFSGGNSIDVGWTDGPATKRVNAILGKYESGSFDGMTDCYDYKKCSERTWSDVFGSAKYIHAQRESTKEAVRKAWVEKGGRAEEVPDTDEWKCELWHHMRDAWSEMSFA